MAEQKIKRLSIYQRSNKKLLGKYDALLSRDQTSKNILKSIGNGENKYLRSHRLESTNYDPKWLLMIEDCIPELGDIIKNPRKVTKTVTDIVPVELARKTNDESVRHLASHSQYVKTVKENGDIVPNKILNIGSDDDYLTYENKFIATLVKRLVVFIEKRYEFLTQYAPLKETDVLMHKTKAVIDGSIVEIETKVKVTKTAKEDVEGESNSYIKRVEKVRTYMLYYMGTDFMKMFKNEKDVRGQILQTNIIRKNPKYHKCYELYRYITAYNQLGIDYKVKEEYTKYSEKEMEDINKVSMSAFLAMNHEGPSKIALAKEKKYKPRILLTMDDEPFVYGPILNNKPLVFIRADDEYFKEERKTIPELVKRPTKEEAEYQKDEAEKKKKLDEEERKLAALKKRREKEIKEFERKQAILAEQERKREAARKAAEEARRRKEELDRIERARRELKATAIEDRRIEEEKIAEEQRRLEEEERFRSGIEQDAPVEEAQSENNNEQQNVNTEESNK